MAQHPPRDRIHDQREDPELDHLGGQQPEPSADHRAHGSQRTEHRSHLQVHVPLAPVLECGDRGGNGHDPEAHGNGRFRLDLEVEQHGQRNDGAAAPEHAHHQPGPDACRNDRQHYPSLSYG